MAVRAAGLLRSRIDAWRTGSSEGQWAVAGILLVGMAISFVVSLIDRNAMPLSAYWLWLVVAVSLLRFGPLLVVAAFDVVAAVVSLMIAGKLTPLLWTSIVLFLLAWALLLVISSRQHTGLPTPLSGAILGDLKTRLQDQGRIPELPEGWEAQSAMVAAHGAQYAGDFLVARLDDDGRRLELILVDVCGKGTTAGPAAIHFAGALGGLIGALPPDQLFRAANDFLLRQREEESFATAVHLLVDLRDGSYTITSAGHPPALRWDLPTREWVLDNARGTALGVLPAPEVHSSQGRLFPGEGLLFYTDGVVESRTSSLDVGISWLQSIAGEAVGRGGFGGAARRIISQVDSGEDDRAVLIVSRGRVQTEDVDADVADATAGGATDASDAVADTATDTATDTEVVARTHDAAASMTGGQPVAFDSAD